MKNQFRGGEMVSGQAGDTRQKEQPVRPRAHLKKGTPRRGVSLAPGFSRVFDELTMFSTALAVFHFGRATSAILLSRTPAVTQLALGGNEMAANTKRSSYGNLLKF